MDDRQDLEVRIYLTGRTDGTLEWQVFAVDPDGQLAWQDGDVDRWKPGKALVPALLSRTIANAVQRCTWQLRSR